MARRSYPMDHRRDRVYYRHMKLRVSGIIGAMWLLITPAGRAQGQELPRAMMPLGAFAFADPSGGRLLAGAGLSQPEAFRTALCSGGRRFSVGFERRQFERDGHSRRALPQNFENLAGDVFAVSQGKIEESASCFIASDALLSGATVFSASAPPKPSECDASIRTQLATSRNRQVVNCRTMASLPAGQSLVLAEFVRQDKDVLASIALVSREQVKFADYRAVYRGEGKDLWRASDMGTLDPGAFHLVFLLQREDFYALGIAWAAEEGLDLSVFLVNGEGQFRKVIGDYWYRAPL